MESDHKLVVSAQSEPTLHGVYVRLQEPLREHRYRRYHTGRIEICEITALHLLYHSRNCQVLRAR